MSAKRKLLVIGEVNADDEKPKLFPQEILPLEELLRRAELGADTRILEIEIELELEHGHHAYEIEYVDGSGRIREVLIDAQTGKVLSGQEE